MSLPFFKGSGLPLGVGDRISKVPALCLIMTLTRDKVVAPTYLSQTECS